MICHIKIYMVLENLIISISQGISSQLAYWILVALIGVFVYFFIRGGMLPNSYAAAMSFLAVAVLLEFTLKFVFGSIGIKIDYGSYTFIMPLIDDITVSEGTQGLRLLSFIFNFGLFVNIGVPFYEEFIKTVTTVPAMPVWFNILVFLYVISDSIIEYIFFFYFFRAIMVIAGDSIGSTKNSTIYALMLAIVPVALYNYFISNPFVEFPKAMEQLSKVSLFYSNAPAFSLIIYFGTLITSFLIVATVLAVIIDLIYGAGASTLKPSWEMKKLENSYMGMGVGYAAAFAILYSLKNVHWHIFFPGVILYSLFKKVSGGIIDSAKEHDATKSMQKGIVEMMHKKDVSDGSGMNWGAVLIMVGIGGLVGWLWIMGWLKF